ncbi:hypothetical protein [Leptospira levettii]|uniref:Uncharacterized protein n=1 Tax=Leptospira levettii TaxID=2023178 RepID=A0ABY2MKI1_9LEPT|nr:hypothetical protein [Leptospira levettii]TGL67625.1 hypothetical protein EHQ60_15365 [Leptospira levettii]
MNIIKLRQIKTIFEDFKNNNSALMNYIEKIAKTADGYLTVPSKILSLNQNDFHTLKTSINDLKSKINNLNSSQLSMIREIKPHDFYPLIDQFRKDLLTISEIYEESHLYDEEIIKNLLHYHTDSYSEKNFDNVYKFSSICKTINDKFYLFGYTIDALGNLYSKELYPDLSEDEDIFELFIEDTSSDFSEFLFFLFTFYQLLKIITEIHSDEIENKSLKIIKIESGSKILKIKIDPGVAAIASAIIISLSTQLESIQFKQDEDEDFFNNLNKIEKISDLYKKIESNQNIPYKNQLKEKLNTQLKYLIYEISKEDQSINLNEKVITKKNVSKTTVQKPNLPLIITIGN